MKQQKKINNEIVNDQTSDEYFSKKSERNEQYYNNVQVSELPEQCQWINKLLDMAIFIYIFNGLFQKNITVIRTWLLQY